MDAATSRILTLFEDINRFPRGSGNEAQLARRLDKWARARGYGVRQDATGNLLIRVPATAGCEYAPVLIIQGHLDMVCEKTPTSLHDFSSDPIQHVMTGDWLKANQTSLGADNGIAIALAMALAEDASVRHPPLELLFTVNEETGLIGAAMLDPGFLQGQKLINIDSEDEGIFTIGCAGGCKTTLTMPLYRTAIADDDALFQLTVDGARGGHSGVDIRHARANAIQLMARILERLLKSFDLRLLNIDGGSTHNAIARSATAILSFDASLLTPMQQTLQAFARVLETEYAAVDPDLRLRIEALDADACLRLACSPEDLRKLIDLLLALPHGVHSMSATMPETVETSNNLATLRCNEYEISILSSQRSLLPSRLEALTTRIEAIARLAGVSVQSGDSYPAWEPNGQSVLLADCRDVYARLFGAPAQVQSMHAGLECAVIGAKYPEMDMISIGPTIRNPHSPDEALLVPSVGKIWQFLLALLAFYCDAVPSSAGSAPEQTELNTRKS